MCILLISQSRRNALTAWAHETAACHSHPCCCRRCSVLLVGYNTSGTQPYWVVKNSCEHLSHKSFISALHTSPPAGCGLIQSLYCIVVQPAAMQGTCICTAVIGEIAALFPGLSSCATIAVPALPGHRGRQVGRVRLSRAAETLSSKVTLLNSPPFQRRC